MFGPLRIGDREHAVFQAFAETDLGCGTLGHVEEPEKYQDEKPNPVIHLISYSALLNTIPDAAFV